MLAIVILDFEGSQRAPDLIHMYDQSLLLQ